jgi:hypothetical protein
VVREAVVVGVVLTVEHEGQAPDLMPVDISVELAGLIARYPLPAGVLDADMNQTEMAQALKTSMPTINKWISSENMPVVQEGGLGKAYILRLSHCWAWKQARDDSERVRQRHSASQINALQASFLGIDIEDPQASLSAKQRSELAQADILHSKAMQQRRQLVPLDDIVELLESIFTITRDKIEAMPDILERELGLRPEQVVMVQRIGADLLTSLSEKIEEKELSERDVVDVEVQKQWLI